MRKTILTYGLISGGIAAILMLILGLTQRNSDSFVGSEIVGYAGIVMSMLLVFFGIRSYRENAGGGSITFLQAFQIGISIAFISSVCYVISWMLVYYNLIPDFMDRFAAHSLQELQAKGASAEKLEKTRQQMEHYKKLYENPVAIAGMTFIESFPVGLGVSIISALILRRRRVPSNAL